MVPVQQHGCAVGGEQHIFGGALNWDFLNGTAGFGISEARHFALKKSYGRAYLVGVANTLRAGIVGVILATILGLLPALPCLTTGC